MFRALLLIGSVLVVFASGAVAQAPDPALLTANPYLGAPLSPFDARVSPYSVIGATNPYTATPPVVVYTRP